MRKKVKFGIIGAGSMGTGHLKLFEDGKIIDGEVAAVADIEPFKLERAKKMVSADCAFYVSGEELIEKACVDAVIVVTPHYSHPDLSSRALRKGINVICEKPAGVYTKQVKEMNAAAEKSGKLFTVMFNQRTNPLYKKMREIILTGGIGQIKRINWIISDWYRSQSYYDSSAWRATWAGEGGGVLLNQCPHQLDLLSWTTGMMPKTVRAFCGFGKWHDIETEDDVTAYFEYENGATGVFVTSTADTPGTNRFEVLGTGGKLVSEGGKLKYFKLSKDERLFNAEYKGGFGEPEYVMTDVDTSGENPQHAGIINNFTSAILGKEKLFVDGREGILSVRLSNAMLLSAWLDKKIDCENFDEDLYLQELNKKAAESKTKSNSDAVLDTEGTY